MNIPSFVAKEKQGLLNNSYFYHAQEAFKALQRVTASTYCSDYFSMAVNTLERFYKGFLYYQAENTEWYDLPSPKFLTADHDILGMVTEIRKHFPEAFPVNSKEEWEETKKFLRDLRAEYTASRYTSYPTYDEFDAIRKYTQRQMSKLTSCVQSYQSKREKGIEL